MARTWTSQVASNLQRNVVVAMSAAVISWDILAGGGGMNLLIRDIPEEVIAVLDAEAARLGLSRTEYLRRILTQASRATRSVTVAELAQFENAFADLADPEVMDRAWQ
jgi:plasmid stability protein